jgi:hypothetical protein
MIPTGGESNGSLTMASVSRGEVPDLAAAYICLWKLATCLAEERRYEPWTADAAQACLTGLYAEDYARFLAAPRARSAQGHIDWLRQGARAVLEAQLGGQPVLNLPSWHPDRESVMATGMTALGFLEVPFLRAVVSDQWNDAVGIFETDDRYIWVCWGTSA